MCPMSHRMRVTSTSAVVNGNGSPGMLAAVTAADLAVKTVRASDGPIAIVGAYNTNTSSGQLAFYAERMAKKVRAEAERAWRVRLPHCSLAAANAAHAAAPGTAVVRQLATARRFCASSSALCAGQTLQTARRTLQTARRTLQTARRTLQTARRVEPPDGPRERAAGGLAPFRRG